MAEERFLHRAVLDTIVPHASDVDLEEALSSGLRIDSDDSLSLLSTIRQRDMLFFDELVPVFVVLRLTNCSENSLKLYLGRLSVKLEAFAFNSPSPDKAADQASQAKDLIYSGAVRDTEDPFVIVHEVNGREDIDNYVFVVWKSVAFLNRPRTRLQHPAVLFAASAALNPQRVSVDNDDYLPSLIPGSANVLQSLDGGQGNDQPDPYLPASRLLRVVPAAQLEGGIYSIQQQTCNPFRVIPIASARVRYSRLNSYSSRPITIASLDFEVTPFTSFDVTLDEAKLSLSAGSVESLTSLTDFAPPVICRPRDDVTLVYKLTPDDRHDPTSSTTAIVSVLNIYLGATISVSDVCRPKIIMQWKTNVDFSMPLNPTFGAPSQVLQRANRPASLSVGSAQRVSTPPSVGAAANRKSYSSTNLGVTISFSGPPEVTVGTPFHWDVFIVNRSDKTRNFAMAPIPRRKRSDSRKHATRPSSASVSSFKGTDVAEAVADENIVYAKQKNAALYETQLISLSTDIRVGPLPPNTCHASELNLLPLSPGTLQLDAVRLIDLATNDSIDIRNLPDTVAHWGIDNNV
ncbi:hypothetical protein VTO42DRAFT_850 [Malbranchea cinnamomea]